MSRHAGHSRRKRSVFRKKHPPAGATPGAMVINGRAPKPALRVMCYDAQRAHEQAVEDPAGLREHVREGSVCWIDVQGLGDEAVLRAIGEQFGIHPLALADVVNTPQRPKIEAYGDQLLIITRMVRLVAPNDTESEQVSLVLGAGYLITFQERYGDVLDAVRTRIRQGGPIREAGPDFLAYAILDAVIDGYYPILESFGEHLDQTEERIIEKPRPEQLSEIHNARREFLALRRAIWPQREMLNALIRDRAPLVSDDVRLHLRDVYDHCVQVVDVIENYRELAGGLMEMHLSSVANRQNDVMRVLTVIATIFIPLTFLAGVYGMNFQYMPELHVYWAYPVVVAVMVAAALVMLAYFRRKGWLDF